MIFKNAAVFYNGNFEKLDIKVENGIISEIGENLSSENSIDITGKMLLPGLIDIHTHGCMGYDFSTSSVSEIEKMCEFYARNGITSVLATSMTMDFECCRQAMITIRTAMNSGLKGSSILGINMEGPFLGADKKGAHDERYLIPIDFDKFDEFDNLSGNNIKLVDIDPLLENSIEFIKKYSKVKTISLAHTSCGYDMANQAIQAGASHVTHLFNAMNGLHHREPGLVGAVSDNDVHAEIISDGIHIHPSVIRLMFKAFAEKMILISDSMSAAGLSDGVYELGGQTVYVVNRKAALADGTIAGSTTTIFEAMKNAVSFGVEKEKAILSATLIPAESVKIADRTGSIETGKIADLLVVNQDFDLEQVYKSGQRFS